MSKPAKRPQDHKRKGVDAERLQAEASKVPGVEETQNRQITIVGRFGEATVTTLNMLDWDAEVPGLLREGDYFGALRGMVSPEDAAALRSVKPTLGTMMTAIYAPDEETGEESPGESQAS